MSGLDPEVLDWLMELFGPSLSVEDGNSSSQCRFEISAKADPGLLSPRPADAESRPCFAFDQYLLTLPTWDGPGGLLAVDEERDGCVIRIGPGRVDLPEEKIGRRWRFTLTLGILELIGLQARPNQLQLHAASLGIAGRSILISGPKRAGKTTLSFHLLRSGAFEWLGNDRAFAGVGPDEITVRGVPTVVRVRETTLQDFPELSRGFGAIERPYLHSLAELEDAAVGEDLPHSELLLGPAQVAAPLGVTRRASAPLGALVFPEVDTQVRGMRIERLSAAESADRIWGNLFGSAAAPRRLTVLEEFAGARALPSRALADSIGRSAPGFRVTLGRGAYDEPELSGFRDEIASWA